MKKTDEIAILHACNRAMNIDISDRCRKHNYSFSRFVFFFYTKHLTDLTLSQIGEICGGRDHATVLYAISQHKALMHDEKYVDVHNRIVKKINALKTRVNGKKKKRFKQLDLLEEPQDIIVTTKNKSYKHPRNLVKEKIRRIFLSNGITGDIMRMSDTDLEEMIAYKIKPHVMMWRNKQSA